MLGCSRTNTSGTKFVPRKSDAPEMLPEISRLAAERHHKLSSNNCRTAIELDKMGANASKQEANGQYEWKASGPPSVSLDVLDSLKSSPETDASRAKLIEQHIQARVAEELKKLQKQESEALNVAHEKIASSEHSDDNKPTSFSLGKEVDELRRKLDERKKVRELPEDVENARSAVIRCLREHDRRPLDCWQEVEDFKAEVKKLEKTWVDKITS